jgi:hypothetical protein
MLLLLWRVFVMRRAWLVAGLMACFAAAHAWAATDATGTWKGTFDFNGSNVPVVFHLTTANGALTGTVEGLPTTPAEIHDGKIDGDGFTFWLNTDYQGQNFRLMYKGKVSPAGDEIAFTFGTEDGSWSAQMTAAKAVDAGAVTAIDVTGTWKGAFDVQGTNVPLVLHLTSAGGVVTGTIEGLPTTPADVHDGKIDGDTVTFWVNTDYQGQTFKVICKGKVAGGQIAFTLGTVDGTWSTQMTAAKAGS